MKFDKAISHWTLLIQETEFEAIVTVNVTLLLVLTTLFIGISNSLPKTAYIKVIDIWLITNLVSNSTALSRFRSISEF